MINIIRLVDDMVLVEESKLQVMYKVEEGMGNEYNIQN